MANHRMLSKELLDEPCIEKLSDGAFRLYTMILANADDDGFIPNPEMLLRTYMRTKEELLELWNSNLLIFFSSGTCVVTHWRVHNQLKPDRHTRTKYVDEFKLLTWDKLTKFYRPKMENDKSGLQLIAEWSKKEENQVTEYDLMPPKDVSIVYPRRIQTVSDLSPQINITKHNIIQPNLNERSSFNADSQNHLEHKEEQIISSSKFKDYEEAFDKAVNN